MQERSTRREFIKRVSQLALGATAGYHLLTEPGQAKSHYKLGDWTGDDFKMGHRLRDLKLPKAPQFADKTVDVVILGGGLAGLATAHFLKDRDFLLLEQYDQFGGQSRGSSYKGIGYSYGAAYYNDQEGNLAALVSDLGLSPTKLEEGKNAWYYQESFIKKSKNKDHIIFKELARLKESVDKFNRDLKCTVLDSYKDSTELQRLDSVKMKTLLTGYDPEFVRLLDSYMKSSFCGSTARVSALAGLYLADDLFSPSYVLPGGNQAITKALSKRLEGSARDSLSRGCFIWSVELKENGASVVYQDSKRRMRRVDANHVVVALPHMISARVMSNLDDRTKSALFRFRYGSYLVANLLLNKRVFEEAYDSWFTQPFDFSDITLADTPYIRSGNATKDGASVLTVYQPYQPGSIGRTLLYKGDRKAMAKSVVEQVSKVVPELDGALEEVVLSRWGHALPVPTLEFYKRLALLRSLEGDNFTFAHSSSQCMSCAEAAVDAATRAAAKLNGKKKEAYKIYSHSKYTSTSGAEL